MLFSPHHIPETNWKKSFLIMSVDDIGGGARRGGGRTTTSSSYQDGQCDGRLRITPPTRDRRRAELPRDRRRRRSDPPPRMKVEGEGGMGMRTIASTTTTTMTTTSSYLRWTKPSSRRGERGGGEGEDNGRRAPVSHGGEMCQDVTRTDHPSASFGMRIPEDGGTNIAPRASARVVGGGPAASRRG